MSKFQYRMASDGYVYNLPPYEDGKYDPLPRVVVIDPDDREQRRRLAECIAAAESYRMRDYHEPDYEVLADALREFANPTPPKPDEPKGLGAVVEDAEGVRWVRATDLLARWRHSTRGDNEIPWRSYGGINVVKVLSEGVAE